MPLYIRDTMVDELVEQLMRATGARTKTEAVRQALRAPLIDKIKPLQARAVNLGPADPDFDMKAFTDEQWGDK